MENIRKIVYINLEKRNDRREHMESQFREYGITNYERFDAIFMPHRCDVGCAMSHLEVLKQAQQENLENILIMEDDFEFLVSPSDLGHYMDRLFSEIKQFDVCFLALNLKQSEPIPDVSIVDRVLYATTASCYLVQNHYYQTLIDLYEWANPLLESTGQHWIYANDVVWRNLQEKDFWVRFMTRIGKQMGGYSDLAKCIVNYNC